MNRKRKGTAMGIPTGLGIGASAALLVTLIGAALISYLIISEKIGESIVGYASMLIMAVASAVGSWIAASLVKRLRLQVCMMAGGCYYLLLLALTALFFGGRYEGMGVSALIVLVGCAIVAFIPASKGRILGRRKRAYR